MLRKIFGLSMLLALAACGGGVDSSIPSQMWQNMEVHVETRPSPPREGMNEVLVMVTDARGRPGYDLMVSLRSSDRDNWVQAIEDGQVGVYRRAVEFAPGEKSVLQVQIKGGGNEGVLRFPVGMRR